MSAVEGIWSAILAEPQTAPGVVARRISPAGSVPIWAGLDRPTEKPLVFVAAPLTSFGAVSDLPRASGFDVALVPTSIQGESRLVLSLRESRYRALFGVLAEDVVGQALVHTSQEAAIKAFLGRLRRWQAFVGRHGADGLTPAEQQGLFAELWTLLNLIFPRCSPADSLAAWSGPGGASHDFQPAAGAIEVKSTSGHPPHHVTVANLRQLDATGIARLLLLHVGLEARTSGGTTLPEIVAAVRGCLESDESATELFEDRLRASGYLDMHEPLYKAAQFRVVSHQFFHVREDFPRIRGEHVPTGVVNLTYAVSLDACAKWIVSDDDALSIFEASR